MNKNEIQTPDEIQKLITRNTFHHVNECQESYLGGTIEALERFLKGKDIITDEEVDNAIISLKFAAQVSKVSTDFNLMTKEFNQIIESLERIKMFREQAIH